MIRVREGGEQREREREREKRLQVWVVALADQSKRPGKKLLLESECNWLQGAPWLCQSAVCGGVLQPFVATGDGGGVSNWTFSKERKKEKKGRNKRCRLNSMLEWEGNSDEFKTTRWASERRMRFISRDSVESLCTVESCLLACPPLSATSHWRGFLFEKKKKKNVHRDIKCFWYENPCLTVWIESR